MNPIYKQIEMSGSSSCVNSEILSPKIEITNKKIIQFYDSHPHINIEEINLYFINMLLSNEVKEISAIPEITTIDMIDKVIQKQPFFINSLSKFYPTADIMQKNIDDIIIIKRFTKPKILIKNFDIESNVSTEQMNPFLDLIDKDKCCGVITSQRSGISNKNHFQIDIHNNNIIIYIHNINYQQYIITSAIDIIDNLYSKMQEYSKQNGEYYTIPKEILDNINNEYQQFIIQKKTIIDTIKEYQKKIISQIEDCRFSSLQSFLAEKYSVAVQHSEFNCELCKKYSGHNLKSLAAHKRGCIRKSRTLTF
jgi:hypothetical protein